MWIPCKRPIPSSDPFFDDGNVQREMLATQQRFSVWSDENDVPQEKNWPCTAIGCDEAFLTVEAFERHYQTAHTNRCDTCGHVLPSQKLLGIHISESHDAFFSEMARRQKMFECLVDACPNLFWDDTERQNHLVQKHKYPRGFHFHAHNVPARRKGSCVSRSREESSSCLVNNGDSNSGRHKSAVSDWLESGVLTDTPLASEACSPHTSLKDAHATFDATSASKNAREESSGSNGGTAQPAAYSMECEEDLSLTGLSVKGHSTLTHSQGTQEEVSLTAGIDAEENMNQGIKRTWHYQAFSERRVPTSISFGAEGGWE
eukprot:Rmarinus@m.2468